ncbi:hypothetical protein [uncultured Friedmanniella sp.]|uniref:hypothetical protein n=1 Tax=uncultured Friedmanniella sp. TaxID=335381 RepID=UPI0035CB7DCC
MNGIAEATTGYAILVGLGCLACCLVGRPRPRVLDGALVVAGLGAAGTAAAAVAGLLSGIRPAELGTHLGYLVTAPLLLPVTAGVVGGDRGRWGSAAFSTGCLVLAVVVVRLVATARA